MQHVVMTRFNARVTAGSAPPDDDWLRDRIDLFDRFTAPSIAAQTIQPTSWIIFCDSESPDWLIRRLEKVATVRPVRGAFTSSHAVDAVADLSGPLITTRLDNDDAIATDFIETVQRSARADGFINLMHGLQLAGERLYRRSDPSNAFISRVERRPFQTVFSHEHRLIVGQHSVRQVRTAPMWLQVVHGRNLANAARGVRTTREHISRFAVDVSVTDDGLNADRIVSAVSLGRRVISRPHRMVWALRVLRDR